MTVSQNKSIAVIGAGIAGLAAAYELQKRGFQVVMYEKSTSVGGRMATRHNNGFQFNLGATFLSQNYSQLKTYATEFKIDLTPMQPGSQNRLVRQGQAFDYSLSGPLGILGLKMISIWSRIRLLGWLIQLQFRSVPGHFFDLSTTPSALDFDSADRYLRRQVGDEVVDYFFDPFTAALHFYRSGDMSTTVVFTLLKMMRVQTDFSARHPTGGMQAIPEALARSLTVHFGAQVQSVRSQTNHCLVRVGGRERTFDAVILACPAPAAQALLTSPTPAQTKLLKAIQYAPTLVVAFRVPADLFTDSTLCLYVPYLENQTIACAIFEARKGPAMVKDGQTLLTIYLHESAAKNLLKKSDPEIARIVIQELTNVCSEARARSAEIVFHDLVRWPWAMPKFAHPTVSIISDFVRHHQGEGQIFFAGDYLNAPWTEGAARSGCRAAELVAKRLT